MEHVTIQHEDATPVERSSFAQAVTGSMVVYLIAEGHDYEAPTFELLNALRDGAGFSEAQVDNFGLTAISAFRRAAPEAVNTARERALNRALAVVIAAAIVTLIVMVNTAGV